jgi:hypothetical protein
MVLGFRVLERLVLGFRVLERLVLGLAFSCVFLHVLGPPGRVSGCEILKPVGFRIPRTGTHGFRISRTGTNGFKISRTGTRGFRIGVFLCVLHVLGPPGTFQDAKSKNRWVLRTGTHGF